MRLVDSHELHWRARAARARQIGAMLRRLARASGRWWRRLGAAGLQASRALRAAG
jgi:hypothetical protein